MPGLPPVAPDRRDRRPGIELAAALGTGALYILSEAIGLPKLLFMAAAGFAWIVYAAGSLARDPRVARTWGFRLDTLPHASCAAGAVLAAGAAALAAAGAAALAAAGAIRGRLLFPPNLLACLALYPLWGIGQEWLILAMIVRNLERRVSSSAVRVAAGAAIFSLLHLPDPILIAATFVLGLLLVPIYLRWRNIVPLGIAHGWLGALAYAWLLERDPWIEVFGSG